LLNVAVNGTFHPFLWLRMKGRNSDGASEPHA
jgi:hypothetical protein